MRLLSFKKDQAESITQFESSGAWRNVLGSGSGTTHVYSIYLDVNSQIGAHPAGFCQLFLVVSGSGWVAGENGERLELAAGEGAYFEKGEVHAKGSTSGMHAIMIQVDELSC